MAPVRTDIGQSLVAPGEPGRPRELKQDCEVIQSNTSLSSTASELFYTYCILLLLLFFTVIQF